MVPSSTKSMATGGTAIKIFLLYGCGSLFGRESRWVGLTPTRGVPWRGESRRGRGGVERGWGPCGCPPFRPVPSVVTPLVLSGENDQPQTSIAPPDTPYKPEQASKGDQTQH